MPASMYVQLTHHTTSSGVCSWFMYVAVRTGRSGSACVWLSRVFASVQGGEAWIEAEWQAEAYCQAGQSIGRDSAPWEGGRDTGERGGPF